LKIPPGVQKMWSGYGSVTDRQTEGQTDNRANNNMSLHFMEGWRGNLIITCCAGGVDDIYSHYKINNI